jgi:hypothetical protein
MKNVREIGDHFFMENSTEISAETRFSMKKNVREIDPGTDVMIFKIFSPKKIAKIGVFDS